jgi:hypothetical protein
MIRHVVMWKLRDPLDAAHFKALLDSCRSLVPGMIEFEGATRSEGFEASADVVLVSAFANADALATCQAHSVHRAVSARLGPLRESRSVLDYLLPLA